MTLKDIIAYCLVIALGIILALHFAFFWIYGGVFIHESNKIILSIETAMSAAILIFGIERLINSVNSNNKRKASIATRSRIHERSSPGYAALPGLLHGDRKAVMPTITTASGIQTKTTLSIGGDTRYIDSFTFEMPNSTEDSSNTLVHLSNREQERKAESELF